MYNILQLSLKEYKIRNNHAVHSIYFTVSKFERSEYVEVVETVELEAQGEYLLELPEDGIFKIVISTETEHIDSFIIHNIYDLLEKKQKFLTDILLRPNLDKCDHNQYYDVIAFNIIFDTYNKLVKDSFTQAAIPKEQLYKIEYLLNRLKNI